MTFDPKELVLYPNEPGVYLMKDEAGSVIYVGKAKNLKTRLKQYFGVHKDTREQIPYLTEKVVSIDTIVALTEKDALLLENTLIKKHQPKYNILLKDDKTFVSLCLTKHKWPQLKLIRYKGKPKQDGIYFGPYTNAYAAKRIYDLIMRLFPIRQCSDSELMNRARPCLLYDIKRCIAPCVNLCTEEEYSGHVEAVKKLLQGKDRAVLQKIEKEMESAAENLEFEKAHDLHMLMKQMQHILEEQHVEYVDAKDVDVIGVYREGSLTLIVCLMFREGKITGSTHFSFHFIVSELDEILETFLLQHYKETAPREILIPAPLKDADVLSEILSENQKYKVEVLFPQRGKKKDLLEMAEKNAKALFLREEDQKNLKEKMLLDLAETLQLNRYPKKVECFDTSNISGDDAVASLVSFVDGEKETSNYRRFKIHTSGRSDDYSAMKEVIRRHFLRAKEKNEFCDLLIVDGGKGQLSIALEVFKELQIASVDVIGVTKEDARHDKGLTEEKIYLPNRKDPILINPKSPLLFFLQRVRDEAHRFAIQYHRKIRSKRTIASELDTVPGIGPQKKKRLLQHFKSVKAIREASIEELTIVKGITKKDIESLKKFLT